MSKECVNETARVRPPLRLFSQEPRIAIGDGFATADEIEGMLAIAADIERRQPGDVPITRSSAGLSFEMPIAGSAMLERLATDIDAAAGVVNRVGGTFRFRRYNAGEQHPLHTDAYEINGWHLVTTGILYLTDVVGGETSFPDASGGPLTIAPERGRLAVWSNYLPDGRVDERALHEGLAVRAGQKVTITSFIYNSRYQEPRPSLHAASR